MVRYIDEGNGESPTLYEETPKAYLTLLVSGRVSQSMPLRGKVELGRDKTNGIVVADRKVSRNHANLSPVEDGFVLTDYGSANGTYVNNLKIDGPTPLQNNDQLCLGDTIFLYTTVKPEPVGTLVVPELEQETSTGHLPSKPTPKLATTSTTPSLSDSSQKNQTNLWVALGCMALTILVLLFLIAFLLGVFAAG